MHLPKKRWQRRLLYLLSFLVIFAIADQLDILIRHHISISHDTTRLTPTDSLPDYLAALNAQMSQGITSENNAAPIILEITGTGASSNVDDIIDPVDLDSEARKSAIYKALHLAFPPAAPLFQTYIEWRYSDLAPPEIKSDPDLTQLARDRIEEMLSDEIKQIAVAPWSAEDHPKVALWLTACQAAFDRLEEACQRPRFYLPIVSADGRISGAASRVFEGIRSPLSRPFFLATAIRTRAMLRLNNGDIPGFQHDLGLSMKLAHLLAQTPFELDWAFSAGMNSRSATLLQTAAKSDTLTASQARALLQFLLDQPPIPLPTAAVDTGERYFTLDAICSANKLGFSPRGAKRPGSWGRYFISCNYNGVLRETNAHNDAYLAALALPDYPARRAKFEQLKAQEEAEQSTFSHNVLEPLHRVADFAENPLYGINNNDAKYQTARNLALTALALRAFKSTTGHFPDSLSELATPDFQVPPDPFTTCPLLYRREKEGYTLYSVGPDLKDNGAHPGDTQDISLTVLQ